ncbi:hypothetical protein Sme01_03590 [Sphaerisporangium melleum]|uniref:Uncharacterized protein n=1 Tax=Sphaerisporangium melleum TaxID=321316 RepID=A0A917QP34_9ACTN|nr:hypothetical protein [Sphaerisporangium melleum]GGK61740.1 hypothetical protein GCM10007964_01140 [Sphaerisporangium melleum]GII67883.1 hypothetical protein Sme01_03590 [Sphaerisporangium melleum]
MPDPVRGPSPCQRLALLGEYGLPRPRTNLDGRGGAGFLMLGDYDPPTPLPVRMAWLRTWSSVLGQPITWVHTDHTGRAPWVVGCLTVEADRGGITLLARAFLTRAEAEGVDLLVGVASDV